MSHSASENYLVNEVMTATPQKLHLMLLDAAIREGERARIHWQAGEDEIAGKCALRAQKIIYGIIDGIDYKTNLELVGKVAGVYLFIYTSLTRAFIDNDKSKLDEALRVLAIERKTWRLMCEQLANSPDLQSPPQTGRAPLAPSYPSDGGLLPDLPASSFSFEA
jgi:flagellar biosynthetic protein FliS